MSQAEAHVTRYKIAGAKCGQATLDQQYAAAAKSFAGLWGMMRLRLEKDLYPNLESGLMPRHIGHRPNRHRHL